MNVISFTALLEKCYHSSPWYMASIYFLSNGDTALKKKPNKQMRSPASTKLTFQEEGDIKHI